MTQLETGKLIRPSLLQPGIRPELPADSSLCSEWRRREPIVFRSPLLRHLSLPVPALMNASYRFPRWAVSCCLLVLLAAAAGCGRQNAAARLPVFGRASGPGGEKFNGSITFLPAPGREAPAAIGSIVQGEYRFDATNGPTAGAWDVVIRSAPTKGPPPRAAASRSSAPGQAKNAPTTEWKFPAVVPAAGPYRFDFPLK